MGQSATGDVRSECVLRQRLVPSVVESVDAHDVCESLQQAVVVVQEPRRALALPPAARRLHPHVRAGLRARAVHGRPRATHLHRHHMMLVWLSTLPY